ncbi:hypothetical protein GJAV_G00175780 [Gymnothorax javanicus]|nr:hypothetical protein GJAV_G00175780 [Gymnothorax javanicus]
MGVQLEEASQRVDECLLRFMDQLEVLEEKREQLNSLIEQGWFSISKARYSMGNKQVSALQYGSEIEPQVKIDVRVLENGEAVFDTRGLHCMKSEHLAVDSWRVEDIGPRDEGVRKRAVTKEEGPKDQPVAHHTSVSKETCPPSRGLPQPQDPLKWFGILVPQSLKQAQASFKKVIELSAEVATLQSSVLGTRKELLALLGEKQKETPSGGSDKTD